ncbi:MAG: DUF3516 domain-containing protein, partial [Actinomycetes bacterium]|nr:DUF3516 domain-containing protein [Actinomycetes bacterium]MDX5380121.1 DUF3516 domain-containing protein [Actinomycetes bacterium]MDX5398729.1 DUF3516 domain-containing protein [Actinomycetes bacterium]MDX5449833.1 DUF3516 domain-containing protein [Actinomycetes bacterium]
RSLRQAGVVEHLTSRAAAGGPRLRLTVDLPDRFALNAPLSPFALAAISLLDEDSPTFALDVVSVVESTLEDPRPLLYAQAWEARGDAVAAMKAEGMEYDERMEALEDVTWPQPLAELLAAALREYAHTNPWVLEHELSPKSVVREMVENAMTFSDLIARYRLGRSEGVVLRYLSDAYQALRQAVPEDARTEEVLAITRWLGALVRAVDSSLLDEWSALHAIEDSDVVAAAGEVPFGAGDDGALAYSRNRHAFRVAIRSAVFRMVEMLAREAYEELAALDIPGWDAPQWRSAAAAYWNEYDWLGTGPEARAAFAVDEGPAPAEWEIAGLPGDGTGWLVRQRLDDPAGNADWELAVRVDVAASDAEGRVVVAAATLGEIR